MTAERKTGLASVHFFWLATVTAIMLVFAYSYIYLVEPFSAFGNDLAANVLTVFSALMSAVVATLVWSRYDRADAPRRVWACLAFALWLWLVAEVIWAFYNMTVGEVEIGLPDVFWLLAYGFFAAALINQYMIVRQPTFRLLLSRLVFTTLGVLLLAGLLFVLLTRIAQRASELPALIMAFYPVGDLAIAVGALWLARKFQGGALARPWVALLVFTVADMLYAWLDFSGTYSWSLQEGNFLSTLADVLYFTAYLVMALGAFTQWLFLKYGLLPVELNQ